MSQIIPTAEPFLLLGDPAKPACLLIHGFTGSPKEMRGMGEYLHQHGYTCLGIRLTGHGTRLDDMIRSRWTDWTASVEDGYRLLCGITSDIFLIGLSMGGVLSLLMSTRLDVRGVVTMSAPARLPPDEDHPIWLLKLFSLVVRSRSKTNQAPGSGWFDKAAYQTHVAYEKNPIRSAAELKSLILQMRAALPMIKVPVLLIHSKNDPTIQPEDMEMIHAGLVNASDKTRLYLTESGHVIPRDASREQVFKAAAEFIQRVSVQK